MRNAAKHWSVIVVCSIALGCEEVPAPPEMPTATLTELGANFEPDRTGTLEGRVAWAGEIPTVPPFHARPHPLAGLGLREHLVRENPNAPQIDRATRGVANAVVYLRGIDPARSRPWDWSPVRLEMRDRRLVIRQGERETRAGIVRRGEAVTMLSRDTFFHSLHAEGAAYFSLAFPDADQPLARPLAHRGLVEWSSQCGYYWLHGYTFVSDHPYLALTDSQGRFTLRQVPPGEYEVVCWLPNWRVARRDLDPDMAVTWRVEFGPPVEQVQRQTVSAQETGLVNFELSQSSFEP